MALVLHALRPEDTFVDVGANVGSYTILAAGVAKAHVIAFEPAPATYRHLTDNIRRNNLESLVLAKNIAVGAARATLTFTSDLDTVNHVMAPTEASQKTVVVDVLPLDEVLAAGRPVIIKIDVEGFETQVLLGASETLKSPSLLAVIMELNGSGKRYGFDDQRLHHQMLALGFSVVTYNPWTRTLTPAVNSDFNTLYVRSIDRLSARLAAGPKIRLNGTQF